MKSAITAEARGPLGRWRDKASRRYDAFDRAYRAARMTDDVVNFVNRGTQKGRARAFQQLNRRFKDVTILEGVRTATDPIAVWTVLKPRNSVVVEPSDPALGQDCVTINYLIAWQNEYAALMEGFWTLEVPNRALGRLLAHAPGQDIDARLISAHHALLRARTTDVEPAFVDPRRRFLIPAGAGVFCCSAIIGEDVSSGDRLQAVIVAHAWVHSDQLGEDQEAAAAVLINDGVAGQRLGDGILIPGPLRAIEKPEPGKVRILPWMPGMPETLALTRGTA